MIRLPDTSGQTYAVMGLGASGLAAANALARSGARVLAWDDSDSHRKAAAERGLPIAELTADAIAGAQALVLSPGIPHRFPAPHPVAERAARAGVPIVCDIELLLRAQAKSKFVGVTGTNGKSTVTALLAHIFEMAKRPFAVGGNLGPAALGLPELDAKGTYILELSSYQIERIGSSAFDIAVLVNISPDHLDRHGGLAGYVAAKESLFGRTRAGAIAVIGADDDHCRGILGRVRGRAGLRVVPVSGAGPVAGGIWVEQNQVIDGRGEAPRPVADLSKARALPGAHNRQNAAAAAAAALAAGIPARTVAQALNTYPGLPHRLETVRTIGPVTYINDSKATNAASALTALECFDNVYWIAGGRAKEGGFNTLKPAFARIRHACLIGEAADAIAATLGDAVPHTSCGTLEAAVAAAHREAQANARAAGSRSVVLLSPGCASFDQFANFEARGDAFRKAVAGLPEGPA